MFAELLLGSILSDESLAKVSLITKINESYKSWKKRRITPQEFDFLYDQDRDILEKLLFDTQSAYSQRQHY
jgi:hypothetical protein